MKSRLSCCIKCRTLIKSVNIFFQPGNRPPQGKIIKQHIDILDHGYSWKREQSSQAPGIKLYGKITKKAFHQLGRDAVRIMRFYLVAAFSFPENGSFHVSQLAVILTEQCGYSFNNRESKRRLLKQLRSAPAFFTETKEEHFVFTSKRRFLGFKRNTEGFITLEFSILHKSNNKQFTDLLIGANAAGQKIATESTCNQTGYSRSRTFDGLKGYKRHNIITGLGIYTTRKGAEKARKELYHSKRVLSKIVKNQHGEFELITIVGNSFVELSDQESVKNGMGIESLAELRSSLNSCSVKIDASGKRKDKTMRETRVFSIKSDALTPYLDMEGQKVYYLKAEFIGDEVKGLFLNRGNKCA